MSHVSHHLFLLSCLLSIIFVSCLWFPISHFLSLVFCLLSPISRLGFPSLISGLSSPVSHLLSLVSQLLSLTSRLLSPVSYLQFTVYLFPVSYLLCLVTCVSSPVVLPPLLNHPLYPWHNYVGGVGGGGGGRLTIRRGRGWPSGWVRLSVRMRAGGWPQGWWWMMTSRKVERDGAGIFCVSTETSFNSRIFIMLFMWLT